MKESDKLTLDSFVDKVRGGSYQSWVTAKRALGRTEGLSAPDRAKALAAIEKHFGTAGSGKAAPAKKAAKAPPKPAARKQPARASKPPPAPKKMKAPSAPPPTLEVLEVRPEAKAPLTYDLHQKMDVAVRTIESTTRGIETMMKVIDRLPGPSPSAQEALIHGIAVIHKANRLGDRNLDEILGKETVAEVVDEAAGIDRPAPGSAPAPPKAPAKAQKLKGKAPPKPAAKAARVPVQERALEDDEELAEEPLASNGRELFQNSLPARAGA